MKSPFTEEQTPSDIIKVKAINGLGYQMDTVCELHDPLDGKPIINHYGEFLHHLIGIVDCTLHRQTTEQKAFLGINDNFVYQIF